VQTAATDVPEERLQKVMAAAGIASRRESETLIAAGRVTVDGTVARIGDRVDLDRSVVAVDGVPLASRPTAMHIAMHKPLGVTSTVHDPHATRTVIDLLPASYREIRMYPVGRLDRDSEGLLLLTNDGPWSESVLHPRHGVEREYAIGLDRSLPGGAAVALRTGITLEEGVARVTHLRPATVVESRRLIDDIDPRPPRLDWYRVTLGQGWKRQVRRMFAAVGYPVVRLVRVRIGPVRLDGMRAGDVRPLTSAEMRALGTVARAGAGEVRDSASRPLLDADERAD